MAEIFTLGNFQERSDRKINNDKKENKIEELKAWII
jgi:hypothetical protein